MIKTKKRTSKILKIGWFILWLAGITAIFLAQSYYWPRYVYAAGNTEVTLNPPGTGYFTYTQQPKGANYDTWSTIVDSAEATISNGDGSVGWVTSTSSNKWNLFFTIVSFNVTAYENVDMNSVTLRVYVDNKTSTYAWQQYYAVYAGYPATPGSIAETDARRWWYGTTIKRISNVVSYDSVTLNDYLEFDIQDYQNQDWSYIQDAPNGLVTFYILTTNQAQKYAPSSWQNSKNKHIEFDYTTHKPQLVIDYTGSPADRTSNITHDTNAAVDATTDGTEVCDNITWGTPRTMYSDESLYLMVNGDSGAPFTGQIVDTAGTVLDTVDDSVRTDGNYDWWIPDISDYSGFVRAQVVTDNYSDVIRSSWAYVAPAPDADERTNDIYSLDTSYPQYANEFSDYIVQQGNIMFVHWKTNIDGEGGELSDYNLTLRKNGGGTVFNECLDDMASSYFDGTAANDDALLHWRYALFTMDDSGPGYNDYDGLVINLNTALTSGNKGFYQPVILDNTDNTTLLTYTHSSYWYLSGDTEGLIMTTDKDTYAADDSINVNVYVGPACRASYYLPDLTVEAIGDTGNYYAGGTILNGNNEYSFDSLPEGDYTIRFIFDGSQVDSYSYIYQKDITILAAGALPPTGPGVAGGIGKTIDNWLTRYGLNNQVGHWAVVMVIMAILFIIFIKSEVLRVVMPLLAFGLALIFNWLDRWTVILLALGAGLTLNNLLHGKLTGGARKAGE